MANNKRPKKGEKGYVRPKAGPITKGRQVVVGGAIAAPPAATIEHVLNGDTSQIVPGYKARLGIHADGRFSVKRLWDHNKYRAGVVVGDQVVSKMGVYKRLSNLFGKKW